MRYQFGIVSPMSSHRKHRKRTSNHRPEPASADLPSSSTGDDSAAAPGRRWGPHAARGLALCLAGGLLLYVAFPPADLWPLAWVALLPLLVASARARSPRVSLAVIAAGVLGFHLAGLAWLTPVTKAGWVGLSVILSVFVILPVWAARHWRRRFGVHWPVVFAVAYVALEWVRTWLFTGFPWLFLGYTQYKFAPILQVATLTGVHGVSFLIALVNAMLAEVVLACVERRTGRGDRLKPALRGAIATVAAVAVCALAGLIAMSRLDLKDGPIVGVVQHNVPRLLSELLPPPHIQAIYDMSKEELLALSRDRVQDLQGQLDAYYDDASAAMRAEVEKAATLSRSLAGQGVQLLIWPETTLQTPLNPDAAESLEPRGRAEHEHASRLLKDLGASMNTRLLIGAPYLATDQVLGDAVGPYGPSATESFANSAFYLSAAGEMLGRYDKMHLVPFGEYVPLRGVLPFMQKLTPMSREVTAGTDAVVFELPCPTGAAPDARRIARFGVLICYEDVYAGVARRFRNKGADFLVNVTDEGWYGGVFGELRQHVAMAALRAVETRTTVVRAANTGISCFIDPAGRIYARVAEPNSGRTRMVAGAAAAPVKLCESRTPYTLYGDLFASLCLVLTGLVLLPSRLWPRSDRQPPTDLARPQ